MQIFAKLMKEFEMLLYTIFIILFLILFTRTNGFYNFVAIVTSVINRYNR